MIAVSPSTLHLVDPALILLLLPNTITGRSRVASVGALRPEHRRGDRGAIRVGSARQGSVVSERRLGESVADMVGFLPGIDGRDRFVRRFGGAAERKRSRRILPRQARIRSPRIVSCRRERQEEDGTGRDQARTPRDGGRRRVRSPGVRHEFGRRRRDARLLRFAVHVVR